MSHDKKWHEERREFLGASEVATILGCNPYGTPFELWAVKKGLVDPFAGNAATQLGQDLEGSILDVAERDLGSLTRDVRHSHDSLPLRATLDGQTSTSVPVECKTAGMLSGIADGWGDEGVVEYDDQIPRQYYIQVQAQLLVTKQELAHLYALLPRRGVCKFQVLADAQIAETIEASVSAWWQTHIVEDVEPSMQGASLKVLSKLPRTSGSIDLDQQLGRVIEDLNEAKRDKKEAEERIAAFQTTIIGALGNNDRGSLPDGTSITYKETGRKAYTRQVAASKFRTLRIKKGKA